MEIHQTQPVHAVGIGSIWGPFLALARLSWVKIGWIRLVYFN